MPPPKRLFIVGAPKCGTTSLARWLEEHPEVCFSRIKEPHYYNTDMQFRNVLTAADYEGLFKHAKAETRMLVEASTWYLFSKDAARNILRDHPDAKFLVMTRDPVDMVNSLYLHNRRKQHESLPTLEAAWQAQERRKTGADIPGTCRDPVFLQYRDACALRDMVDRLRQVVPAENLMVLHLDQMRADTPGRYRDVLAFIGVSDDGRREFPVHNEASEAKVKILMPFMRWLSGLLRSRGFTIPVKLRVLSKKRLERREIPEKVRMEIHDALCDQRLDPGSLANNRVDAMTGVRET